MFPSRFTSPLRKRRSVANHGKDGNVAWNDAGRDAQIRFTARDIGADGMRRTDDDVFAH